MPPFIIVVNASEMSDHTYFFFATFMVISYYIHIASDKQVPLYFFFCAYTFLLNSGEFFKLVF